MVGVCQSSSSNHGASAKPASERAFSFGARKDMKILPFIAQHWQRIVRDAANLVQIFTWALVPAAHPFNPVVPLGHALHLFL